VCINAHIGFLINSSYKTVFKKIFFVIFILTSSTNTLLGNENIVDFAISKELYKNIQWVKLLHYDFRNEQYKSRALNSDFFFASNGKTDPKSEIIANIEVFLTSPLTGDDHPACKFPARYNWLKKELNSKLLNFDFSTCKKLNRFKQKMKPKSISLMFVSAMMDVPASTFGHTFIKFNKEDGNLMTDYTFSYVAKMKPYWYFETIFRGLTGGFEGFIEYLDFQFRIKYYNIYENRNMWEFQLNFTAEEIEVLLNHLWELEWTTFRYYFTTENCAYYNSYILEIARPSLKLVSKFDFVTIPADTMKRIIVDESILTNARYYPANILQYQAGYSKLSFTEQRLVHQWFKGNFDISEVSSDRKNLFLNTVTYRAFIDAYDNDRSLKEKNKTILEETFRLMSENKINQESFVKPDFTNPSIGHLPSMIGLNYGSIYNINYLEFALRPLMHDYTDSPIGYLLYSEISVFQGKFIYNFNENTFRFKHFDFIRMLSMTPVNGGIFNLSWNGSMSIGLLEPLSPGIDNQFNKYALMVKNGYGYAYKISAIKNEMSAYFFLNGVADLNPFKTFYRAGLSAETGIFWYPFDIVTTNLIMEYGLYYPYLKEPFWKINGNVNVLISRNVAFQTGAVYNFYQKLFSFSGGIKLYY